MEDKTQWKGMVSIKKGLFVKSGYAEISELGVKIYKSDKPGAKLIDDISRVDIIDFQLPEYTMTQAALTGYKGFTLHYRDAKGEHKVNFWAKGFGAIPDMNEVEKMISVIGTIWNLDLEEVESAKKQSSNNLVYLTVVGTLLGFFVGGLIGATMTLLAMGVSYKVWESNKFSKNEKYLIIAGISIFAIGVILLCNIFAIVSLGFLTAK